MLQGVGFSYFSLLGPWHCPYYPMYTSDIHLAIGSLVAVLDSDLTC